MKYNRILINSILVYIFITFWFTWIYLEYTKQNETSTNKTNFDICEYFDNKKAAIWNNLHKKLHKKLKQY
jgi:hypothetical protein